MRALRAIEIAAWSVGLALLSAYGAARSGSAAARADALAAYRSAQPTPAAAAAADSATGGSVPEAQASAAPAAVLRIPSIGLEVPVDPGTDESTLSGGAGHIEGTAALGSSGNVGIAAHRDSFFRPLKDLTLDAEIYLAAGGREWRYRVVDLRIVDPDDVHVLAATAAPSITLVTCYPFYFVGAAPRRYIVRAELDAAAAEPAGPASAARTSSNPVTTAFVRTRGEQS
jgi:sortase A